MLHIAMAVAHPVPTPVIARAALIPTAPHAIAVYALVLGSFVLVWMGNRHPGDDEAGADVTAVETEGDATTSSDEGKEAAAVSPSSESRPKTARKRGGKKKLTRAQKRRRGHINWIQ